MQTVDTIIIGAGPGGAKAAQLLAQGGRKVALVEHTHMGGVCLNCGCIPTKMLLGAVAPKALLRGLERQRVARGEITVEYAALQKRVQRFTTASSQTLAKNLTAAGVAVFNGRGECVGPTAVQVRDANGAVVEDLVGTHIILAGGSRPAAFPGLAPDHDAVLDSTDLLRVPEVPASLFIIGAGAIGLEMADFFNAMGSTVTVVEAAPHIAPTEDADLAAEMHKLLQKSGITCMAGVKAASLRTVNGQAELVLENGQSLTAAKALVAVGRTPNTDGLGAEAAGCTLDRRGFVQTDATLAASPTVYAIGDINGRVLLAHAAEHQAAYVARRILGQDNAPYAQGPVPACVYGGVEMMRVGKTARQLQQEGIQPLVSRANLVGNAIAQAGGDPVGFVKIVWDGEQMAGIAALGHGVSHLVTVAQLLLLGQFHGERLHQFMFAHPTLDEILSAALHAPREAAN